MITSYGVSAWLFKPTGDVLIFGPMFGLKRGLIVHAASDAVPLPAVLALRPHGEDSLGPHHHQRNVDLWIHGRLPDHRDRALPANGPLTGKHLVANGTRHRPLTSKRPWSASRTREHGRGHWKRRSGHYLPMQISLDRVRKYMRPLAMAGVASVLCGS